MATYTYRVTVDTEQGEHFEMFAPVTVEQGAWTAASIRSWLRDVAPREAGERALIQVDRQRGHRSAWELVSRWTIDGGVAVAHAAPK